MEEVEQVSPNSDASNTCPATSLKEEPVSSTSSKADNARYCIQRIRGNQRKKSIPFVLCGDKVTIGRAADADVFLPSNNISRCHAILIHNSTGWSIQDSQSTNGVFVNDNKLKAFKNYLLYVDDIITLGPPAESDFAFRFLRMDGRDASLDPPCKMAKGEENELVVTEENLECSNARVKPEDDALKKKLEDLEQKLRDKENSEKILQEKLLFQEKAHQENLERERERIMKETAEAEEKLKENLQLKMKTQEQQLKDLLASQQQALLSEKRHIEEMMMQKLQDRDKEMDEKLQKEQKRLEKELGESELKAAYLQVQLRESNNQADQSKALMLSQFEELLETEMTCSICSELFIQAITLGCSHTFCLLCISQWKRKKKECAICRTKIKSETRALVIDNFIERMVEKMPPHLRASRQEIINSRAAGPSSAKSVAPGRTNPQSASTTVLGGVRPRAPTFPSALRVPTVLISRLQGIPQQNTIAQGVRLYYQAQPPMANPMPQVPSSNNLRPVPPMSVLWGAPVSTQANHNPVPMVSMAATTTTASTLNLRSTASNYQPMAIRNPVPQPSAYSRSIVVSQPSVIHQQTATPVYRVQNPAIGVPVRGSGRASVFSFHERQRAYAPSVNTIRQQATGGAALVPTNTSALSVQASAQSTHSTSAQNAQSIQAIVISDSSDDENDTRSDSSESSVEGHEDYYYGGYGRCFSCGRRGHWANGCPDRY